jgi:phosphoribulokinase
LPPADHIRPGRLTVIPAGKTARGYSSEAVVNTNLRRMPGYVKDICPQFSKTQASFRRVPATTDQPCRAPDPPKAVLDGLTSEYQTAA